MHLLHGSLLYDEAID